MHYLLQIKLLKRNYQFVRQKILLKFLRKKNTPNKNIKDPNIKNLEVSLSDKIGLNVEIRNNKRNKGTITFSYHDIDQLNKIIEVIKSNY